MLDSLSPGWEISIDSRLFPLCLDSVFAFGVRFLTTEKRRQILSVSQKSPARTKTLSSRRALVTARSAKSISLGLLLSLFIVGTCASQTLPRPDKWAQRVPSATLKNWYKIDDDVYRSEQPTRQGFEEARAKGIRSIINLRHNHSDVSRVEGLGLFLSEVPMTASGFTAADIVKALRAIQAAPKPVLVHCQYGSDRSGVVLAMYRIVVQGWTKEDALAELTKGGFGFHKLWYPNIPAFIRKVDVAKIKEQLKNP
jgi:tyrosine-protein phosphatase SIW14